MTDLEQFRADVRQWLDKNCPASQRLPATAAEQYWGGRKGTVPSEDARIWYQRMRDQGWIAPEWPQEYGGGGLNAEQARILKQEMKRINARTPLYGLGLWMLGPALLEYGNEQQKAEHLPDIINAETPTTRAMQHPRMETRS